MNDSKFYIALGLLIGIGGTTITIILVHAAGLWITSVCGG